MFQSVGVVGIAAGVGYFVMQQQATPHPVGAIERSALHSKTLVLTGDAAGRALANTSILAKAMKEDAEEQGKRVSHLVGSIASIPDEHLRRMVASGCAELTEKIDENCDDMLEADNLVRSQSRKSELLQAVVVIVGTLQSGLGSLLIVQV
ncbi:hypothetical protein VWZ88_13945 [Phaeobacter sp. JH20_36]|uniref:hypothetical protein n=1 Tax=unclassified Phaeobacter TaxID=2621772 RepID=UPI003A85B391